MSLLTDNEIVAEALKRAAIQLSLGGMPAMAVLSSQRMRYEAELHNLKNERNALLQEIQVTRPMVRLAESDEKSMELDQLLDDDMMRETIELLATRREVAERKKQEALQAALDEEKVHELLLSEPALSWKMKVSPETVEKQYWPDHTNACGYSILPVWNPSELGKSAKEMLEAYNEIQQFRYSNVDFIKSAVQEAMNKLWDESSDERIFQRAELEANGQGGWHYPHGLVEVSLGTHMKKNIDEDYWKTFILNEIGRPMFNEEYNKWHFYCRKLVERSKDKPRLHPTIAKISELEETIKKLTEKNNSLEIRLNNIRLQLTAK